MKTKLIVYALVFLANYTSAQDVEKLLKTNPLAGKGLEVKGTLGLNLRYYNPWGILDRTYSNQNMYYGNVNFQLFEKINVPLSFRYMDGKSNFQNGVNPNIAQPINRLSLKPKYKTLTAYIGTNNLTFGKYNLSGQRFDGFGLEYLPKNGMYGGFMIGNLRKAVKYYPDAAFNRPTFRRNGMGAKLGYIKDKDIIEIGYFQGIDKTNSFTNSELILAEQAGQILNAKQNHVLSLKGIKNIKENFIFSLEMANSITNSLLSRDLVRHKFLSNNSGLAIDANIIYKSKGAEHSFQYSRISKNYQSFGLYYMNVDQEIFSVKNKKDFLEKKLQTTLELGLQEDGKSKPQSMKRFVTNANVQYDLSESFNLNANYSNFTSYSNLQNKMSYLNKIDPYIQLDTLDFMQINQNFAFGLQKKFKGTEFEKSLAVNNVLQKGKDKQGSQNTANGMFSTNLMFSISEQKKKLNMGTGFSYNKINAPNLNELNFGPTFNISKVYLKNTLRLMAGHNMLFTNNTKKMNISTALATYSYKKKHNFSFNANLLNSRTKGKDEINRAENFTELTLTAGYIYNFSVLNIKFK